jgi:hypothetical protein
MYGSLVTIGSNSAQAARWLICLFSWNGVPAGLWAGFCLPVLMRSIRVILAYKPLLELAFHQANKEVDS